MHGVGDTLDLQNIAIRQWTNDAVPFLRVYFWEADVYAECELLIKAGVKASQIAVNLTPSVTITNNEGVIDRICKAVPIESGGSGILYTVEVHGLKPEHHAEICKREQELQWHSCDVTPI